MSGVNHTPDETQDIGGQDAPTARLLPNSVTVPNVDASGPGPKHTPEKKRRPWVKWVVGVLVFFLGVGIGGSGSDPTKSSEYQDLQRQLSSEQAKAKTSEERLDELEKQLKDTEDKLSDLEDQSDELDKRSKELDEQKKKLEEQQKSQEERQSQLDEREKSIASREEEKKKREQELQAAQRQAEQEQQSQQVQQVQTDGSTQQQAAPQAPQQQATQNVGTVHGGAFCSTEGATGISDRGGATLTCRVAADGRLRWKR